MKIEHLAIMVQEPKKMAQWYAEHLGMKVLRSFETPEEPHFLIDEQDKVVLEIYNRSDLEVPDYSKVHPGHLHIAFRSEDVESDFQKLVDAGAQIEDQPSKTSLGDVFAMLRDPWGVPVQLVYRADPLC